MVVKFIDVKYKELFKNLNLQINENQITAITGKNGSGKTKFLDLIFGLNLDFDGEINIDSNVINSKVKNNKLKEIIKNIFYLMQDYPRQLFNVNVFEDIKYGLSNLDIEKLYELLKNFNLKREILNKNYFELSRGEQKKILIITMLISDKNIILLDDPTSDLDQKSSATLIKLLKKEKRKNKIIIIASQDSEFLLKVSDKIIAIDNGNLIVKENKYEFLDNHTLLNKTGLITPKLLQFRENVLKRKSIKLVYRDNINDLIKDIYRNAK